jgi:Asp/Glu/Hydantoin racemase
LNIFDSKISLIHATSLAMEPVAQAFQRLWPQARRMNVLDDSLSKDLAAAGSLTPAMRARILGLARYAQACGSQGILFTCSAFGPAIDEAASTLGLPILKPNEAMFQEAFALCAEPGRKSRIGLLTTFAPATASMRTELLEAAQRQGLSIQIEAACACGAMDALRGGDVATHDRLVLDQAIRLAACDLVMLGQFSIARVQAAVAEAIGKPVLSSPDSAVRLLRQTLQTRA